VLRRAGSPAVDAGSDPLVPAAEFLRLQTLGRAITERDLRIEELEDQVRAGEETANTLRSAVQFERERAEAAIRETAARDAELAAMHARRVVRLADKAGDLARRVRRR
jgi:hypothetical protein